MRAEQARAHIEQVDFTGWDGLPRDCRPSELFAQLSDDTANWAVRPLGESFDRAAFALVDIAGYYRPTISVRDGSVVLFDGMNPELAGGFTQLIGDLGDPRAQFDYRHGTLPVTRGEWPYPERGLTLFVNTTADRALHVAVYAPGTLEEYEQRLRPHLGKTLRPRPGA